MYGKKGMSPLIATILLMAFAVAIGAVIMNWAGPEGNSDCAELGIELNIAQFCLADGMVNLDIRNTGEMTIEELILQFTKDGNSAELSVEDSNLGKGQRVSKSLPAVFSGEAHVDIFPVIVDRGEEIMCAEPVKTYSRIPNC